MLGPLEGVRVVDWTQYGVGPFATSLLGAMGASVIHVEGPRGDPQQRVPPTIDGVAACYINFNTSKRSIFLDLTDERDRRRMWQLIEGSDVLVNNFKPSSVQRLGFTPDAVRSRNPDIIYCMSNGWGESGPLANKTGTDPVLQYFGGWCSVTGEEGGSWEALRFFGHIDLNASMYIAGAVLTALATRSRMGGQTINLSMLEATLAMQSTRIAEYLNGVTVPGPLGSAASAVAPSQAFLCEDQRWLAVSAETDGQWQRLCQAIDRDALAEHPDYATNARRVATRSQLARELSPVFLSRPAWWWVQQLTRRQVPCSTFWDFDLINVHPQVRDNDHVIELDAGRFGTVFTGGPPWKFARAPARVFRNPEPGEHTAEVLAELDRAEPASPGGRGRSIRGPSGLPFAGWRVLELATGIAGPYCGSLLADQGADVLKLEPPNGDRTRAWGPPFVDGVGAAFLELNRNKRTARVPGPSDLLELAGDADVVIVDSVDPDGRPPHLDQDGLSARRPDLIVCSISAYGGRGPMAGQPGSELTVQAMSNTWAGLGAMGKQPRRLGVDQAMMNGGLAAYQAIMASLFRLERTGEGDLIHVSALGAHHSIKGMHWTCLSRPDQWPGAHLTVWTSPEDHGDIRAQDRPISVAFSQSLVAQADPEQVRAIIEHFGGQVPADMDLAQPLDPRWRPFWSSLFASSPWEEVASVVEDHGGTVTPWLDYADLDCHPQVTGLAPFVRLENSVHQRVVRLPWRTDASGMTLTYQRPVAVDSPHWQ
jgi:crotonobetainyl-CoA:carnitine CoA-transferase CaiB-like acyl-CoA transferase